MSTAYEAEVTIDLKEAGLTHSSGKADACAGRHKVPAAAVTIDLDAAGLIPVDEVADYERAIQVLHEQAHPHGTRDWRACREPGCWEAGEAL